MIKTCYIINFYFGERRKTIDYYSDVDRLCFVKKQIETLNHYKHNLSKIVFNFNIEPEHYNYLNNVLKIIPKKIQSSEIEVNIRENIGMSYGAWSNIFEKYKNEFDYYIFNEDDYFFVEDNFDSILINKFNSYENCGYLCAVVINTPKPHAGHSTGISSSKVLTEVYNKNKRLPYSDKKSYSNNEIEGQVAQTYAIVELGYKLYDIRDEYRVQFANAGDYDVWRFFQWNEKELIKPAILIFENKPYTWWISFNKDFQLEL